MRILKIKIFKVLIVLMLGLFFLFFFRLCFAVLVEGVGILGGSQNIVDLVIIVRSLISELFGKIVIIGVVLAVIIVFVIGFRFIVLRSFEEIVKIYDWFKYVVVGCVIFILFVIFVGFLVGFEENFYNVFKLLQISILFVS